ncbi:hypothetical protein P3S67_016525 [Capsicum chacoense]
MYIRKIDVNTCKDAYLRNCSGKFALFCNGQDTIKANKDDEDYLDHVPGMPTRFSYDDLKAAMENFTKNLGDGRFGSIFEGWLEEGTKIAVKCLDGIGQVKNSFFVEVETIGIIHHKIIQDVAKGLAYLHEECRQKILHLDIKPPNILLDEKLNAKLSEFGLAKLIDRNQSQVMTMMRGTPGYLAPEWLSGVITEKVDVYSFGIVILEILSGRRHFEASYTEEERIMLNLFRKKAEEGQLVDLIDKHSEDMQFYKEEVIKTMQIAAWCLQSDYTKRPSMSMVVKVMEGALDVEKDLDYNFKPQTIHAIPNISFADSTTLLPSVLSDIRNTDVNTCEDACLRNCSCKAALFCSGLNFSTGDCYLPSEIFSLANNEKDMTRYDAQAFIKVQEPEPATHIPKTFLSVAILGSIIGSSILGIIIGITVFIFWKKKKNANEDEEDYLDHMPGMPTKFSYDDLKAATENFTKKLGEGGFGSVFEGCLEDGTKIAVKCFDRI